MGKFIPFFIAEQFLGCVEDHFPYSFVLHKTDMISQVVNTSEVIIYEDEIRYMENSLEGMFTYNFFYPKTYDLIPYSRSCHKFYCVNKDDMLKLALMV